MKYNNTIRPLLILAFIAGSFPLHSADFVPEQNFTALKTQSVSLCPSEDKGSDDEQGAKSKRSIASYKDSSSSCL